MCLFTQDTNPELSLSTWIIYGLALDKAIDSYGTACQLHSDEPSELERYCLRAALLGKLPKGKPSAVFIYSLHKDKVICT